MYDCGPGVLYLENMGINMWIRCSCSIRCRKKVYMVFYLKELFMPWKQKPVIIKSLNKMLHCLNNISLISAPDCLPHTSLNVDTEDSWANATTSVTYLHKSAICQKSLLSSF